MTPPNGAWGAGTPIVVTPLAQSPNNPVCPPNGGWMTPCDSPPPGQSPYSPNHGGGGFMTPCSTGSKDGMTPLADSSSEELPEIHRPDFYMVSKWRPDTKYESQRFLIDGEGPPNSIDTIPRATSFKLTTIQALEGEYGHEFQPHIRELLTNERFGPNTNLYISKSDNAMWVFYRTWRCDNGHYITYVQIPDRGFLAKRGDTIGKAKCHNGTGKFESNCKKTNSYDGGSKYGYFRLARFNINDSWSLDNIYGKIRERKECVAVDVNIKHRSPEESVWNCRSKACWYKRKTLEKVKIHEKKCTFLKIWCKYGCGYNGRNLSKIKKHEIYCDEKKSYETRQAERKLWTEQKKEISPVIQNHMEQLSAKLKKAYPISKETRKEMKEQALYISREEAEQLIKDTFPKSEFLKQTAWNHGIHISGQSNYRVVSTRLIEEIYLKRMQPKKFTYSKGKLEDTKHHFVCGDFSMAFAALCLEEGLAIPTENKFAVGLLRTWRWIDQKASDKFKICTGNVTHYFTGGHVVNLIIVHDNNGKKKARIFEPQSGRFLDDEEIEKRKYDVGAKMVVII